MSSRKNNIEKTTQTEELTQSVEPLCNMPIPVPATDLDKERATRVKELTKQEKVLATEMQKLEKGSLKIMFALHTIADGNLYELAKDENGKTYKNVYDYSQDKFGLARGTTSDYISLIDRFGERDEMGNFTGQIYEEYREFKTSVLARLHRFCCEDVDLMIEEYGLTPTCSYRKVMEIIKQYNEDNEDLTAIPQKSNTQSAEEENEEQTETTTEETGDDLTIENDRKINVGVLVGSIQSIDDLEKFKGIIKVILDRGGRIDLYKQTIEDVAV